MEATNNQNRVRAPKRRLDFAGQCRRIGVKTLDVVTHKGKQNIAIIGAAVVLMLIFFIMNSGFLSMINITTMSRSLAPYAIMALGVTFVIATGMIDLSIGTVTIASAVIAGKLYTIGMPLELVPFAAILVGLLFGFINGLLIAKLHMPAFIATLGTMMFARGFAALIANVPNVFFPNGTWYNSAFSNLNGFPIGLVWVIALMIICMVVMYKTKVGRYILAIGSNEEATRLSGIDVDKYKIIAFCISGAFAGIAAVMYSAAYPTVATATGNGMELDAIAGVYIGGTSASGGIASIAGSVIGSLILVIIRNGLNLAIATYSIPLSAEYLTYVITGIIVVIAVLMDVIKTKNMNKVRTESKAKKAKESYRQQLEGLRTERDYIRSDRKLSADERQRRMKETEEQIRSLQKEFQEQYPKLLAEDRAEKEAIRARKAAKRSAN